MFLADGKQRLGVMPGFLPDGAGFGAKVISIFPDNFEQARPSHQGAMLMFDPDDGRLTALLDAGEITGIRTAAASAVATDILARKDASVLAILGYGEQAARHLESIPLVRNLAAIRIWGRSPGRTADFIAKHQSKAPCPLTAAASVEAAVEGADIICTTTASIEPILPGALLTAGMHVNLVGASTANEREADDEVVGRSRFYVDLKVSTMVQAGEFLSALGAGRVTEAHLLGQIGEVIAGRIEGRRNAHDITVYKSVGISAQDLASATFIVERAIGLSAGVRVPFSTGEAL
jgi:ornithine cyclodeaminase